MKKIIIPLIIFLALIFIARADTATECVITQGDTWTTTAIPNCAFCSGLQDALAGCDSGYANYHWFSFNSSAFTFSPSANVTRWYIKGLTNSASTWYGNVRLLYVNHDCPNTVSNYNYYTQPFGTMYYKCSAPTLGFDGRNDCYWLTTINPKSSSCWTYFVSPDFDWQGCIDPDIIQYTDYYQRDYSMYSAPQLCIEYTTTGTFAPEIEIISPQDYQNLPQNAPTYVTLTWTTTDSDSTSIRDKVYYDGTLVYDTTHSPGTYQTSVYVTTNDFHYWKVIADDGTHITDSEIYWFSVGQNFSPEPVLYAPTNGTNYPNTQLSVNLNYTCTDQDSASVTARLFLDGTLIYNSTFAQGTLQSKQVWVTTDRTYRWYVRCTDGNTDIKSETRYFSIGAGASTNLSIILNAPEDQIVFPQNTASTLLNFTTTSQLYSSSSTGWHEKKVYNQTASLGSDWDTYIYNNHLYGCVYNSSIGDLVYYYCDNLTIENESCYVRTVDTTGDVGEGCSIRINPTNSYPGIAYSEWAGSNYKLKYSKASSTTGSGSWTTSVINSPIENSIPPKLRYHSNGNAYILFAYMPTSTAYTQMAIVTPGGSINNISSGSIMGDVETFTESDFELSPSNNNPTVCGVDSGSLNLQSAVWNGASWITTTIDSSVDYDYCNVEFTNDTYSGISARIISTSSSNQSLLIYSTTGTVMVILDQWYGATISKPYMSFGNGAVNKSIAMKLETSGTDYWFYCKGGNSSYPDIATNCLYSIDNWEGYNADGSLYKVQVHKDSNQIDYVIRRFTDGSYKILSQIWYGTTNYSYYNNILQELYASLNGGPFTQIFTQTTQPGTYAYNYSLLSGKTYGWYGIATDFPDAVQSGTQYFYTNGIGNISNATYPPIVQLIAPYNGYNFDASAISYLFQINTIVPIQKNLTNKIYIDGQKVCEGNTTPGSWQCTVNNLGIPGVHYWYATSSDGVSMGTSPIWNYTKGQGSSGTNRPPVIGIVIVAPGQYVMANMSYTLGIEASDPESDPIQYKVVCGYGSSSALDLGWQSQTTITCPGHPSLGTYITRIYVTDTSHGLNYYDSWYPLTMYVVNESTYNNIYESNILDLPDQLVNPDNISEGILPAVYNGIVVFASKGLYWILGLTALVTIFLLAWFVYTKIMNG